MDTRASDAMERFHAEQRLRESEERYRAIAELTGEWIWTMDLEGRHTSSNAMLQAILGYSPEEFLGKPAFPFMHPDDSAWVKAELSGLLAEKRGWRRWIIRWRRRDGNYLYLESNAEPIIDGGGRMLGFRGSDRDVTERIVSARMEKIYHDVVHNLYSCRDLREAAEKVLHAGLQLDCVDCGGFYVVNHRTGSLELIAHHGLSNEYISAVTRFEADSPRLKMLRDSGPLYVNHPESFPNDRGIIMRERLRGIAVIPVKSGDRLVAVLNLASHVHDSIPAESRRCIEMIALQAGTMLLRLRSDLALRENEEVFRQFLDHSPAYIYIKDDTLKYTILSRNHEGLLGKPIPEMIGKQANDLFPPEAAGRMNDGDRIVLREGREFSYETLVNGRWYTNITFPITISGNPPSVAGYSIDITDRKNAEAAISAEKEQLATTLRSIGDGVITTDIEGRIQIMNKVAEDITGQSQDEALGRPFETVLAASPESTSKAFASLFEEAVRTGRIVETAGHSEFVSRAGGRHEISASAAPLRDRTGAITGIVTVIRDMTEKLKMMESLRRIDKLDSLGLLAGGIAHDFNNLLCGILGHLDLARMHRNNPEDVLRHLDKALGVFSRARDLTQQLLSISKGGAPKRKAGRLTDVLEDSAAFALSGSNILCNFKFEQDLWLCEFDENQVGQVISNIVINAQQAMPRGGRIVITAGNMHLKSGEVPSLGAGKYVRVSIADSGVGIPGDLLGRIFDPFFSTKQLGNGLGLSICYSIMRKHDGLILVESEQGKGSTFHLYFPASGSIAGTADGCRLHQHRGSGTILIMDDETVIRDVLGQMLQSMGYSVVMAGDGREALRIFAESRDTGESIRAAFFDLTIPDGMGGKEAIRELRMSFPDLPVFVSSGYVEDPAILHPENFCFTASIRKPYLITDLADLLNRHLIFRQT
ncbi:MAG TPA: PAS domain S-box protein [Candidatus Ozemobacteraceae bacterium]|nr:PAS domain S-box protein [Candidatus Ozemobacteraceae bacterium]